MSEYQHHYSDEKNKKLGDKIFEKLKNSFDNKINNLNKNTHFICDGCGKKYSIENFGREISTPNLSGIVICKNCNKTENKMEKYLGVKLVEAESTSRIDPTDNSEELGYKVVYEDGYESWSPKDVFEKAYRRIKRLPSIFDKKLNAVYQYKVYVEAVELEEKIVKLNNFLNNHDLVLNFSVEEKNRLQQQLMAMQYYLTILVERIENF